ncbi:hypothetical protein ROW33_04160 [Stenotrophomonas maltophilia]|uniref:hypothetical protein n=1 Tax=Stenotrophomonas maltophilia TaxID=40324 RepID=UPI002893CEAE|nr:hypothetical protein [Stenotrophomonas maltophilia]MDT3447867.1 hypothetical protein [Stenotrophomonas maltophilia]
MRHLALPFFCVVFLGVALGEAFANGISSRFGVAFLVAAILWAVIAYIEIRAAWAPFAAAMQRRRAERQRAQMAADDTH